MFLNKVVLEDCFGRYYKLHTSTDKPLPAVLRAETFSCIERAKRMVVDLTVPHNYWRNVLYSAFAYNTFLDNRFPADNNHVQDAIAQLLYAGKIGLYKIDATAMEKRPSKKSTLQSRNKNNYTFLPVSHVLIDSSKEIKTFNNERQAQAFVDELNPSETQLKELCQPLHKTLRENKMSQREYASRINAILTSTLTGKLTGKLSTKLSAKLGAELSVALADGGVIVTVDRFSAPAKQKEILEDASSKNNNKQGFGVGAGGAATKELVEEEKIHDCLYKKLSLTCRHNRKVTLDPANPPKDGSIIRLQVVSSKNEALVISNKNIFEIITVDAEIDDVCPSHQTNFISIGDSEAKLIGQQSDGKLAKFKAPSKEMLVGNGNSILKYLWLPNVEKDGVKHYKVHANNSCDFSHFAGKANSVQLDVYPYMKWSLKFNINVGTIKNDGKPSNNKIAFGGSLTLQQDNKKADEFSADYKKKLEIFENTLNNFQSIITENIFDKFQDGRDIEIDVTLPKLVISYDTQFAEKPNNPLVVRTHEFNFEAAPFIDIKASVDILPVIVSYLSSWWSRPFNAFFDWVKQKYGEVVGEEKIKASISFKVSINGDLSAKFSHKRDESEKTTIEGEPIKAKITIKAEGEASMDGHIYVVKVEVLLKAGVESSLEIGIGMGNDKADNSQKTTDNDAPFISLFFMFNGVKVYLEKEVQVSLIKDTPPDITASKDGDMFDEVNVKEVQKYEKVWLKMSNKHQFKYYLDADDNEDIQTQKTLENEKT